MKKNILSIFLFFASTFSYAESAQSLALLKSKIEGYVLNQLATYSEGKVQVTAEQLDPRLNLKPCAENNLEIFNPYQTALINTNTMAVKCKEETNRWTLYVPIKITILKTVLVAKHALLKGNPITNDDLYATEMDIQKLKQGYFTDSQELIGLICKHNIAPDNLLTPYNIELAKLVHKGEQVTIVASNGGLTVSMDGIAMNEGALGDTIKVKNLSSKRIIEVQISGNKEVKVTL